MGKSNLHFMDMHVPVWPSVYVQQPETIKQLNLSFSEDEEVVCVTENDACGVDGIQAILSCTAGKGNLKFRDTGKMAFSFLTVEMDKKFVCV